MHHPSGNPRWMVMVVKFKDLTGYINLNWFGTIAAGDKFLFHWRWTSNACFYRAPIPIGSDTVVMQEKVTTRDGFIEISDESFDLQDGCVREAGS